MRSMTMELHKLGTGKSFGYTTWGCMWRQGRCDSNTEYRCIGADGSEVELQSRITAYWPDGSVKWTAHTADASKLGDNITVTPKTGVQEQIRQDKAAMQNKIVLQETDNAITIRTERLVMQIVKNSTCIFESVEVGGKLVLADAQPVLQLEQPMETGERGCVLRRIKNYTGCIDRITVEECKALQAVIKYEGIHRSEDGECKIPFLIRLTVGRDTDEIKLMHTFLYDGDENKDFLKGVGIRFARPMEGALYDRHIKLTGDHGTFHEVMVPMLSWRPKVPAGLYERQMSGGLLNPQGDEQDIADRIVENAPHWSEYVVCQDSPNHFLIKKKLAGEKLCYIDSLHGNRTDGVCALGGANGSVLMGVRDFWEKYPSGYTVKGLDSDRAECTMWFYAPEAPAFDFRHYADRGYNQVCYEGYDYKGADPVGIACTSEAMVALCAEPVVSDDRMELFGQSLNSPAVYVGTPEFYHQMRAFGYWSLPQRGTEMECWLEKQLEEAFDFYQNEVEQRGWYGLFNYGDLMHSYDSVRHQWKYDIGGYAWDNTELVPTLWLWLYFMRSGRADVFALAEKLSRHASEVDVYHFGRYKGLGSRHNVRHWGCPCKEARIAMAHHHRYLYYLTGDRRLEDIFDELKDNEESFLNRDPLGDFYEKEDMVYPSHARSGPDWSSLCSNWMTQWERTLDNTYRDKIVTGLDDIRKAPLKLSSGPDFEFDPHSCHLRYIGEITTGGCHLQVCMGAPQIWLELADLLQDEEFKDMLADYGRFYYLPHEQQLAESNGIIGDREFTLPFFAAALGAYGAVRLGQPWLARRTWEILLGALVSENSSDGFVTSTFHDCGNRKMLVEIPWITTNFTAQWCLNVIMALEFIREALPETMELVRELVKDGRKELFRKA